jgi:sporulation protein YlmC with PRC-barrel domain
MQEVAGCRGEPTRTCFGYRLAVIRCFQPNLKLRRRIIMAQILPIKPLGLVLSASSLKGDKVVNRQGEDLGKIEELMVDLDRGRIAYAVLSFGGFLGMGDKLFAIPWQAFSVDTAQKRLILNAKKELLEKATGFDKSNWPNMADPAWGSTLYKYYGYKPYWD